MKRNTFNLSHDKTFSMNMGDLVPIACVEVLPGDTFNQSTTAMVRVAPTLAPTLHPVHVMVHHFYVPNRLVWSEWEDFITRGPDGISAPVFPTMVAPSGGYAVGSLADHLGVRPSVTGVKHSALPMRACALVYNERFRDQDLEDPIPISKASGNDTITSRDMQKVAWAKDYFTTARPWPQKGPEVYLPLGETAPVVTNGLQPNVNYGSATNVPLAMSNSGNPTVFASGGVTGANQAMKFGSSTGLEVDLSQASAVSINDLRSTSALQRFLEKTARTGSRYDEFIRSFFGVKSSDARLQRPEYLGGGINTLQWSEVIQTAEGSDPVGMMRGHGIGTVRANRYARFFEEHGYVISFMSVKPVSKYMQGLERHWNRRSPEDYFVPEFQNLGQQEIENKEVYVDGTPADDGVFGYQDRYDEYRGAQSYVSGEMRTVLKHWHMGREFATRPALNKDFIKSNPTDRIYASTETDQLYVMAYHTIHARRPIARRANPILK